MAGLGLGWWFVVCTCVGFNFSVGLLVCFVRFDIGFAYWGKWFVLWGWIG